MTHEELIYSNEQPDSSFLNWLMTQQLLFELSIVGTDGSLLSHNTLEHGLTRGVIGEAQEALEALTILKETEVFTPDQTELLTELEHHLKVEIIDILIFLGSVFVHAGMSPQEVMELAMEKMDHNGKKYAPSNFSGKTIDEGIKYSRSKHDRLLDSSVGSSSDGAGEEGEEQGDYAWYSGNVQG